MKYRLGGIHDSGGILRATLVLECEGQCTIPLRKGEPRMGEAKVWGWDGNAEPPTVTPSIACTKCGFHKTLVSGQWQ